ncbi:MAG: hypothetical protein D6722_03820 [Bacteroidetes bacterium]|nr:MAG: hypothetical protein D6722_03820 [Bacteroidota bacterium]
MKTTQNPIFFVLMLMLLGLTTTTFTSCAVEGCTDPNSDNYDAEATKDDGSCIPSRDKFIATYQVNESCPSGNITFQITVTASASAENAVIINNLGDFGQSVTGTVNGNSISIPNQNISSGGFALSVNGSGSINGDLLIINYTYNFSGGGESCTMNCTKL